MERNQGDALIERFAGAAIRQPAGSPAAGRAIADGPRADGPRTLLELKDLDKIYDGTAVLHGVNLTVRDGEFMTVLGPSGSGKTTILRLIGGLTEPSRGAILLDGVDISAMR